MSEYLYRCPASCECEGGEQNSDAIPMGKPCAFCDAGKPHAWHDDGSYNTEHAEFLDDWVPSQNPPKKKREGDPRFLALLDEIEELHARKQRDYGTSVDPFANVRASEDWGIAPYLGALIRLSDKIKRLQTYAKTGKLANEGVEDSLKDISVYALISLILFREQQRQVIEAH